MSNNQKSPALFRKLNNRSTLISWSLWIGGFFIIFHVGCSNQAFVQNPETYTYRGYPIPIQKKVDRTCNRLGITHFVIKDQTVLLKKQSTGEVVSLNHYRPVMPDGYYYCNQRSSHSSDLE